MMRNPWIIALALALLLSGTPSKAADDSTFLIPETDIIKAMQAAVRADDKTGSSRICIIRCAIMARPFT